MSARSPIIHPRSLVSIQDLSIEALWEIVKLAQSFKTGASQLDSLKGKIVAHAFFEPSTRTRLSFEAATLKLGGQVIGFADPHTSSAKKGERLEDTIRMLSSYADAVVLRHPEAGAALRAARVSHVPVINAGDGANEHPTQTLVDLFTLWETQGRLADLRIGLVGDLRFSRTVHSLVKALSVLGSQTFYCIAPHALALPESLIQEAEKHGCQVHCVNTISEIIPELDVLYMNRLQVERLPEDFLIERYEQNSTLMLSDLRAAKAHFKILHPLPRLGEIPDEIDLSPYAYYFEQASNGLYVRQALLHHLLG